MLEKLLKHSELTQMGFDYPKTLSSDAMNCNIRKFDVPPHLTRGGPTIPDFFPIVSFDLFSFYKLRKVFGYYFNY